MSRVLGLRDHGLLPVDLALRCATKLRAHVGRKVCVSRVYGGRFSRASGLARRGWRACILARRSRTGFAVFPVRALIMPVNQAGRVFGRLGVKDRIALGHGHACRFRVFHLPRNKLRLLLQRSRLYIDADDTPECIGTLSAPLRNAVRRAAVAAWPRRLEAALVLQIAEKACHDVARQACPVKHRGDLPCRTAGRHLAGRF